MGITTENAAETHQLGYFLIGVLVLFFDIKAIWYALAAAIAMDAVMWNIFPGQLDAFIRIPRDIAIRYFCYLWLIIAVVFIVKAVNELFSLARKWEDEATYMASRLQNILTSIKVHATDLSHNTAALQDSSEENIKSFDTIEINAVSLRTDLSKTFKRNPLKSVMPFRK